MALVVSFTAREFAGSVGRSLLSSGCWRSSGAFGLVEFHQAAGRSPSLRRLSNMRDGNRRRRFATASPPSGLAARTQAAAFPHRSELHSKQEMGSVGPKALPILSFQDAQGATFPERAGWQLLPL